MDIMTTKSKKVQQKKQGKPIVYLRKKYRKEILINGNDSISSHGDYLSNHRYFIVCIPNSRYSIYVSDRLLLYFTIYQDKLENKKIVIILATN